MSVIDIAQFLTPEPAAVSADAFKGAMRALAGAVSVITVGTGPERTGFTATSVSSLSVDPPALIVSLNRSSSSWSALKQAGVFAVNVLAHDQVKLADNFAGKGGIRGNDRYVGGDWHRLSSGTLGLDRAVTVVECELEEAIERNSHAILIGRVLSVEVNLGIEPLLYWDGRYQTLAAHS